MPVNVGTNPPDYSTPTGQFRALIGDTDAIELVPPVAGQGEYVWFGDAEIGAFLSLYGDSPKRAAARALLTIAGSQALLLKKWSSDDLSVDGAAIAEALRKQAKDLQDEADNEAAGIDIFELIPLAGTATLHPELAPFKFGTRYGLAEIGDDGSLSGGDDGEWVVDDDGYIVNG